MNHYNKIFMSFIVFTTLLMFGCINEDLSECVSKSTLTRTSLYFSYTGDEIAEIFNQKISKINLFVFSQDGKKVFSCEIDKNELNSYRGYKLNLDPGEYNIVCIGNAFENTLINEIDSGSFQNMNVMHPNHINLQEIPTNDSLYYGYKTIITDSGNNKNQIDTISFVSMHTKMHIQVSGLSATHLKSGTDNSYLKSLNDTLILKIRNLPSSVDFNNQTSNDSVTYNPTVTYDSNSSSYISNFNILKLDQNSSATIDLLYPDGTIFYSVSLKDFLLQYPFIDVTKNEVLIPIQIIVQQNRVKVEIPDWVFENLYPGFLQR